MNKQSLYLFGGALLASTALTTGAQAALIKTNNGAGGTVATTAITAFGLATQVFSGTAATAGAVTIGGTTSHSILIDYNSQITSPFNIQLDVAGAEFTGTPTLTHYYQSTSGGSLEAAGTVSGCSVQTLSDKILISGCDPSGGLGTTTNSRVDAIGISGIGYVSAGALATAGTSITLSGLVRNSANTITFENITAAPVVTSKTAIVGSVTAAAALTVDNNASPAFSSLTGTVITASLGSVQFSATGAVGTDLSYVFTAASITTTAEVKITHGVLSDDALTNIQLVNIAAPLTRTAGQFVSGTVSFQVAGSSLHAAGIQVAFNGTSAIDTSSGSATVTPSGALAPVITALGAFSGSLTTITRGGLSIQLNTVLSSAATGYASFIRVMNTSALASTATVTVTNDATGAAIGSYTTASIPASGMLTISSSDIESALSLTASATVNYRVVVSGSFNGYAQHLVFNQTSGVFSDFSGFRNGALTVDP